MAQRQEFETIVRLNAKEAEDNVERLVNLSAWPGLD